MIKRQITFYFQTLSLIDSFIALFLCMYRMIGISDFKGYIAKFKIEISKMFECDHIYFYNSARSALYAHLKVLEFPVGSEVIVIGFTCDVVANSVIQAGLTPTYVDINEKNFCMSVVSVKSKINSKTRVIIIQHTFGIPEELDELLQIAEKHDLYVIEDCAVSLGSKYNGKYTGTFGDAAIFSFELSKTITSCRGGMLLINTDKLNGPNRHQSFYNTVPEQSRKYSVNILFQLGLGGILYEPNIFYFGKYIVSFLYKMNVFKKSTTNQEFIAGMPKDYVQKLSGNQCFILQRQFKRLLSSKARSNQITFKYFSGLKDIDSIKLANRKLCNGSNLIRFPLLVENRDKYLEKLNSNLIEPGLWFTAPLSSPSIDHKLFKYKIGSCPTAERIADKIINLPTHNKLNNKDVNKIIGLIKTI